MQGRFIPGHGPRLQNRPNLEAWKVVELSKSETAANGFASHFMRVYFSGWVA
jgi:hypothetical protein